MSDSNVASGTQKLRFYQNGTFTVGNRLVSDDERAVQARIDRSNALDLRATAPARAAARRWARATPSTPRCGPATDNVIAANATGCLEVFTTPYPETSWQMPWIHSLFGNAAAVATGMAAAMRVKRPARRCASSRRAATAAPPTSASAACPACSSATTTCSTSATTTKPT